MPPTGREHKAPKESPKGTKEEEVKANEKSGKKPDAKETPAPPKPPTPLEGECVRERWTIADPTKLDHLHNNSSNSHTPARSRLPTLPPCAVLYRNVVLLEKYVENRDARFLGRVLRYTNYVRSKLPMSQLRSTIDAMVADPARRAALHDLFTVVAAGRTEPVVRRRATGDAHAGALALALQVTKCGISTAAPLL